MQAWLMSLVNNNNVVKVWAVEDLMGDVVSLVLPLATSDLHSIVW
jgi:hypothetical protein